VVDVYLVSIGDHDRARAQCDFACLSADELARHRRFLVAGAALQFAVARTLLRAALSARFPIPPGAWTFEIGPAGKPALAASHGVELAFNLSHTDGLVALAVGHVAAVGVDVENTARRGATVEIADRFFAAEEVAALASLPANEQRARFFDHWTLKESYIKSRGQGLGIPLGRFGFRFPGERALGFFVDPDVDDHGERHRFWLGDVGERHRVALAVDGPAVPRVFTGPATGPWTATDPPWRRRLG
jgi:4'-phosphopantetheinyl transferase